MTKNKSNNRLKLNRASKVSRFTALAIVFTLLVPVFMFQPEARRASASVLPIAPAVAAPAPLAFVVGSGESVLADIGTSAIGLAVSAVDMVSKLFGKEKIPAGLEQPGAELKRSEYVTAESNSSAFFMPPQGAVRFDFDHDGKADLGRWQASNSEWKVKNSGSGTFSTTTIGSGSSIVAPGDFDGDGYTDPAVFNAGTWTIKGSSNGQTITVAFGASGDKPVVGDYDGDGKSDCAVFRPSTNTWWILQSTTATYTSTAFGAAGDITIPGNFDGDAKTDIAVFRPSTGDWHVQGSTSGYFSFHWGIAADIPVSGDFDGDGKTDFAVYRGSTGTWYISKSETGNTSYIAQSWGNYGDQPVPADYDGDGKDDIAVWRPTTGIWYIIKSQYGQFDYPSLGVAGDVAINSAYLKQIGGYIYSSDFAKARLSPTNATGGTNLYSRNFGWSSGLVGLPGRAGMDMGFGISYNSLVWTKDTVNNTVVFNADNSNLTPGFNFGFPTIEPAYFDAQTGKFAYLMVSPSGSRTEFRQTAASGVYETADSSYAQLKINENGTANSSADSVSLTLTTTDGTQRLYEWKNGSYKCQKITDRNGNFISINHDSTGKLLTVTDTLGRMVTVNYNTEGYPSSITQNWKDQNGTGSTITRTYATFTYTTQAISTKFMIGNEPMTVFGPGDGYSIKVLQKITFPSEPDGSGPSTSFDYNTWGQVWKVTNRAADNHVLNYSRLNLPADETASQPDCPRFTETYNWVENFNQNPGGVAQETKITNSIAENQPYSLPDGHNGSATMITVSMAGGPNSHYSNTFVRSSGWMEGLTIATEDFANGSGGSERKRWTWTDWTQDNVNLAYILNPRTIESKVGDTTNIKRSTTEYYPVAENSPIALYGLVQKVKLYDTDQTTVLKESKYSYILDSAYISRRIIGLPSLTEQWGLNQQTSDFEMVSKFSYQYDEGDFTNTDLKQVLPLAVQHDANYGASLIVGRGNLTSVAKFDTISPLSSLTSSVKYNTTGAAVEQTDAVGRKVTLSYDDSFNDTSTSRYTFAYPTKFTDPVNNTSEVKYRFDTGANVWARSPAPAGNTTGKVTTRSYDGAGRIERETLVNTGAYTRYVYSTKNVQSRIYSTIVDVDGDNDIAEDEVLTENWTDGAGRIRRSRTDHPGSTGGWTGVFTEYDVLGRAKRTLVPTEISVPNPDDPESWTRAGDDASRPWLWNQQEYDWKGRVTRSIPSGSDGTDGKDRLISYEGCGCAGGQVVTTQSELVPRDDQPSTNARRTQKAYEDILGRVYKTETVDWNGNVYNTSVLKFNGRDQVMSNRLIAGIESSGNYREETRTYDGYGRLKTQHDPRQDPNKSTEYTYNDDDKVATITDARGAVKYYQYNAVGLPQQVSYQSPTQVPIVYTEPTMTGAVGNVDGSIYKLKFSGLNIDSDAELSVDILLNLGSPTQNLRFSNLDRSTVNGEQVLTFDIASDSYLYNYVNSSSYSMTFSLVNPSTNKKTQAAGVSYITFGGGRSVIVGFTSPARYYDVSTTPTVTFDYDNVGNRISMTDGAGTVQYHYNQLSQLTSETREFNDTVPFSPTSDNKFKIEYNYGLSGQLMSYKEPFGEIVSYGFDRTGRLKTVSGNRTAESVQLNYISDTSYRAWGAVKDISYPTETGTTSSNYLYDNRLQIQQFNWNDNSPYSFHYVYNNDTSLKTSDVDSGADLMAKFDRSYSYDFAGNVTRANTGAEARGQTETNPLNIPYRLDWQYNRFGEIANEQRRNYVATFNSTFNSENGRITSEDRFGDIPGWVHSDGPVRYFYDNDGRKLGEDGTFESIKYDAEGQIAYSITGESELLIGYDGDGGTAKIVDGVCHSATCPNLIEKKQFFVKSAVLGETVSKIEVDPLTSNGWNTMIYGGGRQIAQRRTKYQGTSYYSEATALIETDPGHTTRMEHGKHVINPGMYGTLGGYAGQLDPLGEAISLFNEYPPPPTGGYDPENCQVTDWGDDYVCEMPEEFDDGSDADAQVGGFQEQTYYIDGVEVSRQKFQTALSLIDLKTDSDGGGKKKLGPPTLKFPTKQEQEERRKAAEGKNFDQESDGSLTETGLEPLLGQGIPKDLKSAVLRIAKKPNCIDVLQELLLRLQKTGAGDYYSQDVGELYDRVDQFGFNTKEDAKRVGLGATSYDQSGVRSIAFTELTSPDPTLRLFSYASTTFQELLHHARKNGLYSDQQLDKAVKTMLTPEDFLARSADAKKKFNGKPGVLAHAFVSKYCSFTQEEFEQAQARVGE